MSRHTDQLTGGDRQQLEEVGRFQLTNDALLQLACIIDQKWNAYFGSIGTNAPLKNSLITGVVLTQLKTYL